MSEFGRVILDLQLEVGDLQAAIDLAQSRHDDRFWARFVYQPFTWQHFHDWWAARRWVEPRDVRRR